MLEHTGAIPPPQCLHHNQVLISWDLEFEDLNVRIVTLLQGLILTPTGRADCKTTPGCQHFTIISIALCESSGAGSPLHHQDLEIFLSKTQTKLALTDDNINITTGWPASHHGFTVHYCPTSSNGNIKNKQGNKNCFPDLHTPQSHEWGRLRARARGVGPPK